MIELFIWDYLLSGIERAWPAVGEINMVRNVSNRMKSVIVRTLAGLRPDVFYTAKDVIYHAKNVDSRAENLDARNVSRYLCVLKNQGLVTMHPAGVKDDAGERTKARTFVLSDYWAVEE